MYNFSKTDIKYVMTPSLMTLCGLCSRAPNDGWNLSLRCSLAHHFVGLEKSKVV